VVGIFIYGRITVFLRTDRTEGDIYITASDHTDFSRREHVILSVRLSWVYMYVFLYPSLQRHGGAAPGVFPPAQEGRGGCCFGRGDCSVDVEMRRAFFGALLRAVGAWDMVIWYRGERGGYIVYRLELPYIPSTISFSYFDPAIKCCEIRPLP
jgi:hypothetical protein